MAFTCCCLLSWLPMWLQSEVVDPCFVYCHIFTKKFFYCIKNVANNALNRWRVDFDLLWANATPTLNIAFSLTNVHAKCLLISSTPLLFHPTSIYNRSKRVCGVFLVFFKTTAKFGWPECSALYVCVCVQPRWKSAYHLLTIVSNGAESE